MLGKRSKKVNSYKSYLNDIGFVSDSFVNKIEPLYGIFSEMCPDEIKDIFITNYVKNDLTKQFQSLWFFSDEYCLEAKQFLTKVDLDIVYLSKSINYWTIKLEDYDYKKASAKSKMILGVELLEGASLTFRAEGKNCDYLKKIINKYIKPNFA